jgi:hypothetical protein
MGVMLDATKNPELYEQWLDFIENAEVKQPFLSFVFYSCLPAVRAGAYSDPHRRRTSTALRKRRRVSGAFRSVQDRLLKLKECVSGPTLCPIPV